MSLLAYLLLAAPAAYAVLMVDVRWDHRRATPTRPLPETPHHDQDADSAHADLEVLVLGRVEVRRAGLPVQLTPKALELTAYLACHPDGVTEDQVAAALWPDRAPRRATFNNLVSLARNTLGEIDGHPALPPIGVDHRYRLHPSARIDLTLIEERDPDWEVLVRGRPFDVHRGFDWAHREGIESWAVSRIAQLAHDTATARLAAGDPLGARDAAEHGLRAAPGDDLLFRDRMLAYAAEQNPAGVERVMGELCAYFEVDDPALIAHPATLEVYRRYAQPDRIGGNRT